MPDKTKKRLERQLKKKNKAMHDAFSRQLTLQQANDDDDYIVFSFKNLAKGYDLNGNKCSEHIRSQLLLKLQTWCQCTWNMLFTKERQSGGMEKISTKSFIVPLPACVTRDMGHLYSLRFNSQNSRLIGFRTGNAFQAIFVDVDLSSYKR